MKISKRSNITMQEHFIIKIIYSWGLVCNIPHAQPTDSPHYIAIVPMVTEFADTGTNVAVEACPRIFERV